MQMLEIRLTIAPHGQQQMIADTDTSSNLTVVEPAVNVTVTPSAANADTG